MKKALFLFILTIPFLSFSQPQLKDGHIFYQEAVEFSDISQEDAYVNTKKWFATTFNDSKEVIRLEDKETGIIIGVGVMPVPYMQVTWNWKFELKFEFKDGRYRYTLSDFKITYQGKEYPDTMYLESEKKKVKEHLVDLDRKINALISNFKTEIPKAEDDW